MGILSKLKRLLWADGQPVGKTVSTGSEPDLVRQTMSLLAPMPAGKLPPGAVCAFLTTVNERIQSFNNTADNDKKKHILGQIQKIIRGIEYRYPPSYLAASPVYQAAQAKLFRDIRDQLYRLGTTSLRDETEPPSSLAEIIANMSPQKAAALLKILDRGSGANLGETLPHLYAREDLSPEATHFAAFLQEHTVSFLGGVNSKVFKVEHSRTGQRAVLKVDNRLDLPRNREFYLRHQQALKAKFIANKVERQVTTQRDSGDTISRTLLVTDYCEGGDLFSHRNTLQTNAALAGKVGTIFAQMARTMLDIQEAGCIFPDAKITNWLVDAHDNVRIADTKSFLFTYDTGRYSSIIPGNEYAGFVHTPFFTPPECSSGPVYADSMHAYILGKNIYVYATGKRVSGDDGAAFDFSGAFFKTEKGVQYQSLIENLVKPKPEERMSLRNASDALYMLNIDEVFLTKYTQFRAIVDELKSLRFGVDDPQMNAYICQKQLEVNGARTDLDVEKILGDMKAMVRALQADPAAQTLRDIIENYRKNAGWFTIGMHVKATRIERAMARLPLEERQQLLASRQTQEVMEALASHRYWGKRGNVYKNEKGGVDPRQAATTFKHFKERFDITNDKLDSLQRPEDKSTPRMK
ncbi:MAG: hypothetical protein JJT82_06850 [Legionellaceae bacterium]|nr:hypothetical protein [Legionellaceae bacterium]